MAGGFDPKMAVVKNKFVEEWNGQREITNLTFKFSPADVSKFLIYCVLVPYSFYTGVRKEFLLNDDPNYHDIF